MKFRPYQKTFILSLVSQVPIVLLLLIFFRIPGLPLLYRSMAVITVFLEAALLSELIGNIVQKVLPKTKGIVIRGVFERKVILWEDIKEVRQIVLSPMKKGSLASPTKLFVVKAKNIPKVLFASDWWSKKGVLANKHVALGKLALKYDESIAKKLDGWLILWDIAYRRPQVAHDIIEIEYLVLDGREKNIIDDLRVFGGSKMKNIPLIDCTYPSFVKKHGGRYAKDNDHVWDTIEV